MNEILKKGMAVTRKSYGNDIVFKIDSINGEMAELRGLTVRITADAHIMDLEIVPKTKVDELLRVNEDRVYNRLNRMRSKIYPQSQGYYYKNSNNIYNIIKEDFNEYTNPNILNKRQYKRPGVILHIDGDKEYTEKCKILYDKMGLSSFVYYIPESEQPRYVYNLLEKIKPNILILTGHDALSKRSNDIYNVNSYKNSKYYIESVNEARRYEHNLDSLVIYAGACQSYYEAIITAGANFASSPKRVLIDIMDPIIVAQSVAYTPVDSYISLTNTISNTREGVRGVGGIQTKGQCREGIPSF